MIQVKTPFRVSLVGGGTDFPEWFKLNKGGVISFAINKYIYLYLRKLPKIYNYKYRIRYYRNEETNLIKNIKHKVVKKTLHHLKIKHPIDLTYIGELPPKSGLGSSSCFTVSLVNGLNYLMNKSILKKKKLALKTINIEQNILKEKVGCQDQVIASYGGFNKIIFHKKGIFTCKKIKLKKSVEKTLSNSLILLWTGVSRNAQSIEKKKFSYYNKKKKKILNEIFGLVEETEKCLKEDKNLIQKLGIILNKQWKLKKKIDPIVSNKLIDKIYQNGINAGADGAKLLGAGNGGFFLFIVQKKNQKKFFKCMKKYFFFKVKFEKEGSRINNI